MSFLPLSELGAWADDAACAGKPGSWFFPARGESTEPAREVCRGCPVRDECLEHALRHGERFGIWGGKSERERRRLRKALQIVATSRQAAACGTDAGYTQHRRRGEETCGPCRAAHAAKQRSLADARRSSRMAAQ